MFDSIFLTRLTSCGILGSGLVLLKIHLGLEVLLTLIAIKLGQDLRVVDLVTLDLKQRTLDLGGPHLVLLLSMVDLVHPGAVLLLALLAEEVQLALVALVQRAQAGLHHLPLKVHLQLATNIL